MDDLMNDNAIGDDIDADFDAPDDPLDMGVEGEDVVDDNADEEPKFGRRAGGAGGQQGDSPKQYTGPLTKAQPVDDSGSVDKYADVTQMTDMSAIPDVQDDAPTEPDIIAQVADAPNVRNTRIKGIRELDKDIGYNLPRSTGEGIDLSLLTSVLTPREKCVENDEIWQYDTLFTQVASDVQTEMDAAEQAADAPPGGSSGAPSSSATTATPARQRK